MNRICYALLTVLVCTGAAHSEDQKKQALEIYQLVVGGDWEARHKSLMVTAGAAFKQKVVGTDQLDSIAQLAIDNYRSQVEDTIVAKVTGALNDSEQDELLRFLKSPMYSKFRELVTDLGDINSFLLDSVSMQFAGKVLGKIP